MHIYFRWSWSANRMYTYVQDINLIKFLTAFIIIDYSLPSYNVTSKSECNGDYFEIVAAQQLYTFK